MKFTKRSTRRDAAEPAAFHAIQRDWVLVRERYPAHRTFTTTLHDKASFDEMMRLAKEYGLVVKDRYWHDETFFVEIKSTAPVFSCVIMASTPQDVALAVTCLEELAYFATKRGQVA